MTYDYSATGAGEGMNALFDEKVKEQIENRNATRYVVSRASARIMSTVAR